MWGRTRAGLGWGSEDFTQQPKLTETLGDVPEILGGLRGAPCLLVRKGTCQHDPEKAS